MKIKELVEMAHANAKEKGFWDDFKLGKSVSHTKMQGADRNEYEDMFINNAIAARLALIHSEVSEALEALRKGDWENFAEELADIPIRVADLAGGLEIDLEGEIERKVEKNKARGYMHNKRF